MRRGPGSRRSTPRRCSSTSRHRVSTPRLCPHHRVSAACGYRPAAATRSICPGLRRPAWRPTRQGPSSMGVCSAVIAQDGTPLDVRHTRCVSAVAHAGYADALAADTIGAAMNPQPNATAAMSFMGLAYVPGRRLPQQSPQSAPPTTLTSHEMAPRRGASRYGGRRSCATCQRRRGGISRQRACAAGLQLPERRRRNRQQYVIFMLCLSFSSVLLPWVRDYVRGYRAVPHRARLRANVCVERPHPGNLLGWRCSLRPITRRR